MERWKILVAVLALTGGRVMPQSYGLLLGVRNDHLRAAGTDLAPSNGLVMGAFMPLHVGNRLVVRAEAAFSAEHFIQRAERPGSSSSPVIAVAGSTLARYYFGPRFCLSVGVEYRRYLASEAMLNCSGATWSMRRSDVSALFGAAYRLSDNFELGVRNYQGMLGAAELGDLGWAKHRSWALMASYLLHYKRQPLAQRRKSRLPPVTACRY